MEISQIRQFGSIEKNLIKCAKNLMNEKLFPLTSHTITAVGRSSILGFQSLGRAKR